jgi:hypothetical protein
MSAIALISGRLQGEPATRPTKTGGQVRFFTLRVANGAALLCSGLFHAETYEWNGEMRVRLKLTDLVLVLKARSRAPKLARDKSGGGAAPSRASRSRLVVGAPARIIA